MPQPGGSATMYGVLYQILGTAHWAAELHLRSTIEDNGLTDAILTIEPARGGGDLRIESGSRRIVEQWKARSDRGAWSLRNVIDDIFPDLYRAVDLTRNDLAIEYRFVTEGHRGRWGRTQAFFAELRNAELPDDPLTALDNKELIRFFPDQKHTRRGFFHHIVSSLQTHRDIGKESQPELCRKLWHLLAHFILQGNRPADLVRRELDSLLRPLVDYREHVEAKRRELCAALLELAAAGNACFTADVLLVRVGLEHVPFTDWTRARASLLDSATKILHKRWRYSAERDVRPALQCSTPKPIVVLSGESGQGKTWQLSSLVMDTFSLGSVAVAVSATGDANEDRLQAARAIWAGFGREGPTDLELVAKKREEFLPELESPWLTVAVDDVQTIAEARALADWDWIGCGIRLAMSALPPIARALKTQFPEEVEVLDVKDFTIPELQRFLDEADHDWGCLPFDLQQTLRQPLLAKLYSDIAENGNFRPLNEYALFERYWLRIRDARNQADHPGDMEAMRQLASTLLKDDAVYPWPQVTLKSLGISPEELRRLESVGWLRRIDDDRVEVVHDRLLNWAVAEALVSMRFSNNLSQEQLAEILVRLFNGAAPICKHTMLGYVTMDAVWLLLDESRCLRGDVSVLIVALEESVTVWRSGILYLKLLPTLGPRIIDSIVERVKSETASEREASLLPGLLAGAVIQIGKQDVDSAAQWGQRMINDASPELQEAGLRVLKQFPSASALDAVWKLHKTNFETYERKVGQHWWVPYERSFAAMKSCVKLAPTWLQHRIMNATEADDPFSELAYLVAKIPGRPGAELWKHVKDELFVKVPAARPRSLAICIQQHSDHDEIPRLESWLTHQGDLAREYAFSALVYLAPNRALDALSKLSPDKLQPIRAWWLPALLLRKPDETRNLICCSIRSAGSRSWSIAGVYSDDPNQMDIRTLDVLLDDLQVRAEEALAKDTWEMKHSLYVPLCLLASVTSRELLQRFEARVAQPLETALMNLACQWGGRPSISHDYEIDYLQRILLKIGGEGLTEAINQLLRSESKFGKLDAFDLCLARPNETTRQLLSDITKMTETWEGSANWPLLQEKATIALGVLGENRAVMESILRWGIVPQELAEIRDGSPPMSDADLEDAMAALDAADDITRAHAVWAISTSGRADLSERVRQILSEADPNSDLALAAIVALDHFADAHADTIRLLISHLSVDEHCYATIRALARNGSPVALAALEQEFRRRGYVSGDGTSDVLAENLARHDQTRIAAAEVLWKTAAKGGVHLFSVPLDCLVDLEMPEVNEFLVEQAYTHFHHVAGQKASAIRTVAEFDADAAFRACETALRFDIEERHLYPSLLLEIDEARSIPILCSLHTKERSTLVKWAIGRALRRAGDQDVVREQLQSMLHCESSADRVSGIDIAAWQLPGHSHVPLKHVAINHVDPQVRRAAERAIARLDRQDLALDLLEGIELATGARCWSYLEAAVKLSDPWLLTTRTDPLWIGTRLSGKTPGLRAYAENLLETRRQQVQQAAEKEDQWQHD